MLLRGIFGAIQCHMESSIQESAREESPILLWFVEDAGSFLPTYQKGRDGRTTFEGQHGKKPTQEFVPFGEKVLARPLSTEPLNRMDSLYKHSI